MSTDQKLHNLVDIINTHEIDIMVLTETWLQRDIAHRLSNVVVAQSSHLASQGVVILGQRKVTSLQPILPVLWSPTMIIVKARSHRNKAAFVVIGHYSRAGHQNEQDEELLYASRSSNQAST